MASQKHVRNLLHYKTTDSTTQCYIEMLLVTDLWVVSFLEAAALASMKCATQGDITITTVPTSHICYKPGPILPLSTPRLINRYNNRGTGVPLSAYNGVSVAV